MWIYELLFPLACLEPGAASGKDNLNEEGMDADKAKVSWRHLWKHIWSLFARQSKKTGCVKRCGYRMHLPIFWVPGELHIPQPQAQNRCSLNIILQSLCTAQWLTMALRITICFDWQARIKTSYWKNKETFYSVSLLKSDCCCCCC